MPNPRESGLNAGLKAKGPNTKPKRIMLIIIILISITLIIIKIIIFIT